MRLVKPLLAKICCVHKLPFFIVRYMTDEIDCFVLGVYCHCLSVTGIRGSNCNMFKYIYIYMSTSSVVVLTGFGVGLRQLDSLSEEPYISSIINFRRPWHVKSWVTLACIAFEEDLV